MKKLIVLLFILILSVSSICNAFEPPNPNRWLWVGSDDKIGIWIDRQTIKASKDTNRYSSTYGCRFIQSWEMHYSTEENTHFIANVEHNLDRRLRRTLSLTEYDDSGKVIFSDDDISRYHPIIPGSWGETILTYMEVFYDIETNNPRIYN